MNLLVLVAGLVCFVTTGAIVRTQFASATMPREVRLGIAASYVGLAAFVYLMLRDRHATAPLVAALAIFMVSLALFLWSARTTRTRNLKLAFDPEPPGFVAQTGPYRYVRHPFYASYILFWLACTIATLHPLLLALLVVFSAVNLMAAFREERAFETSPFAAEYMNYRKTAGLLWPKLGGGRS